MRLFVEHEPYGDLRPVKIDYEAATKVRFLQGEGTEEGWERNRATLRGPEPDRHVVAVMRRHRKYVEEIVDAALVGIAGSSQPAQVGEKP